MDSNPMTTIGFVREKFPFYGEDQRDVKIVLYIYIYADWRDTFLSYDTYFQPIHDRFGTKYAFKFYHLNNLA